MARATKKKADLKVTGILRELRKHYPAPSCHLVYSNPFELLVATMLAAQCTDARVNQVTPHLFQKYSCPQDFARANLRTLEKEIRTTGFFRNKAKAIKTASIELLENFDGNVPSDIKSLVSLPGVGRKTANVILGNVFHQPALIVDTHVKRVTHRLGLTTQKDPDKIEIDLQKAIPQRNWTMFSHQIGENGRTLCEARKPKCQTCFLSKYCQFQEKRPR